MFLVGSLPTPESIPTIKATTESDTTPWLPSTQDPTYTTPESDTTPWLPTTQDPTYTTPESDTTPWLPTTQDPTDTTPESDTTPWFPTTQDTTDTTPTPEPSTTPETTPMITHDIDTSTTEPPTTTETITHGPGCYRNGKFYPPYSVMASGRTNYGPLVLCWRETCEIFGDSYRVLSRSRMC